MGYLVYLKNERMFVDLDTNKTYMFECDENGNYIRDVAGNVVSRQIGQIAKKGIQQALFALLIEQYEEQSFVKDVDKEVTYQIYSVDVYSKWKYGDVDCQEVDELDTQEIENSISKYMSDFHVNFFKEYVKENGRDDFFQELRYWYEMDSINDSAVIKIKAKIVEKSDVREVPTQNRFLSPNNLNWISDQRSKEEYVVQYRLSYLKEVMNLFSEKQYVALVGEHGIGKSMIARNVAAEYNGRLFWVAYSAGESFCNTILELNCKWNPNTNYESIDQILTVLNSDKYKEEEWLLVIDNCNANDLLYLRDLSNFLGRLNANIKVLITSIRKDIITKKANMNGAILNVEPLDDESYKDLWINVTEIPESANDEFWRLANIVKKNTYITILVASIVKDYGNDWNQKLCEINEVLMATKVEENADIAVNETDWMHYQESGTLFEFIKTLFDYNDLADSEIKLLECLVLYPLTGVEINEFEQIYGENCRSIIKKHLLPKHWIESDQTEEGERIYLHPVVRNVVLRRTDENGNRLYNKESTRKFIKNLVNKVEKLKDISNYACAPYAELIYNCFYYLQPFAEELLNVNREQLLDMEDAFDPELECGKCDFSPNSIDSIAGYLGYIYTSLAEYTYLGEYDKVYPISVCIVWYLRCKLYSKKGLSIKEFRWLQGSGYSQFHTKSEGNIKERELEFGHQNIVLALNYLSKLVKKYPKNSEEYYCVEMIIAMIHGNIASYYTYKGEYENAYEEYLKSKEIRVNLHETIKSMEEWTSKRDFHEKDIEMIALRGTSDDNIAYVLLKMKSPDYYKALQHSKLAYAARKQIKIQHDRFLHSCINYMKCFVSLVETDLKYNVNSQENREDYELFVEAREIALDYYTEEFLNANALYKLKEISDMMSEKNEVLFGKGQWEERVLKAIRQLEK